MALTDSNDEQLIESKTETRSPLGIDLNEIPTCCFAETLAMPEPEVDSIDVVRAFHDNPDPAPGPPAALPWGGRAAACGACGRPETGDAVMVCDGCERGFHLECAGIIGLQAPSLADWLCRECVSGGVRSKRWPLGVKSKRILDINASPPSDVDCDGSEEVQDLRKHASGDNSYGGNAFGAPVTHSNFVYAGKEFGCQKASGIISHTAEGFDNLFASCTMDRSFKEVGSGFQQGRLRSGNNAVIRFPSQNAGEVYLQALRQFISERHGVLEEGWHVELKHSLNSYGLHAVYYAPDGQTFGSMYEVAHYLGLMSNQSSVDSEIRTEGSPLQERLHLPRKRKLTRFPAYGFSENKETLLSSYCEEIPSNGHNMGTCAIKSDNFMKATESGTVGNGGIVSEQNKGGFPVQFEDFFILSLGQVKTRPSYHDVNLICPVGYRSCWHDKITGSLFTCEVLDGGDSGPVFKVQRSSCTALAVPTGSTVLLWSNLGHGQNNEKRDVISDFNCGSDNDANIQMILSDPCPPQENDILICFGDSNHVQAFESSQLEACCSLFDNNENPLFHNLESRDEIGVISVEDRSPYAAWRMMSQKFIELCSDMCKRKGKLKFLCKHVERETGSVNWNVLDECNKLRFASLAKFCSSQASRSIPFECQDDEENGTQANMLSNWLDQDRFGLDADFVQEMIEQLPGVEACLRYEFLKNRSSYSASVTVGNGLLIVRRKAGENMKEEGSDGFFGTFGRPRLGDDHVMDDYHPPGKPLCLRLPPEHTGDFHEVWEFFSRFHDILGLKEAFASHELEEELINPWFDRSILNDKLEKEIQGTEVVNLHRTHGVGKEMVATSNKSRLVVSKENPHAFIQMETEATKAAAESRLASVTYSRCFGVALTKAHISLLKVLICELQSKVAAFADRNFDSGEIRSRRGRKKDFDSFLPSRRIKINMLPVNELTWPELVRRYILAVSSMDGNLESAEITARESGKVLRCLQGDGGVLCGSLTGVAGMEADAILLAEATKKIFGSLNIDDDILTIEDEAHDVTGAHEKNVNGANIPEWAQMLEPVRKLPTNVGTRIRKCVYDALEKGPPEWARKILEHSISKEVYKGNASGPTKKAVLSVLADVRSEGLVQKSDRGNNKKIVVPVSDIIMKQCRIVLRRAAAADDAKIFCNLLGRKLMNSTDNDDEGLLGSPGMVSRPLDFRTIDLRLAVGAYGRSHEAFLEDVRELWNNVRAAYADQPDFVELAETLSQNFESLYEAEVIALVQKLVGYSKLESLSVETRKEINDILASTSEIPKAPWDEGVCKVCGIDKDDDSVLLCDTCDAEYHMYCLNPPLARIPEGNWYCPSCCVGKPVVQGASECSKVISQRGGKKYQGEVTRVCLEALTQVAAAMEEKEYWDFSLQERIFLLKFLCDELLNSALVRQHLEQCVETTPESQQKLRSFSVEWKNLKSREDFLAARVVQGDENMLNAVGETGVKEGLATGFTNHGSCIGQLQNLSDGTNNLSISYDDPPTQEGGQEGSHINCSSKHPFATYSEKNHAYKNQHRNSLDSEILQDAHTVTVDSNVSSSKSEKSSGLNELPWSNPLSQEIDKSSSHIDIQGDLQDCMGKDVSSAASLPSDHHALCLPSGVVNLEAVQGVPSVAANESQAYQLELDTIKGEIRHLQGSITCLESQLLKQSVRREFLGSDSGGRLYWISATPGGHPRIIVDGSLQQRKKLLHTEHSVKKFSGLRSCASSCTDTGFNLVGSKASCPFLYDINNASATCSRWTFYQTDAEIEALINWLKDSEPKERELKESILNWQKQRFWDSQHSRNHVESPPQTALAMPDNCEKVDFSNCLVTKAAVLLEKRYGPCSELEGDTSRKQGETTKLTNEGKMHRCECLEPIWPSRSHCSLCHKTFSNNAEFEEHNNGRCTPGPPANKKSKEVSDSLKGKGNLMPENPWEECFVEKDKVETSKHGCSKFNSRLIKFQNEESACPYDFEDVCRKFVTKDSNKELVQEIGLIGSSGIPSFVSSLSPFLSDSTLTLITQKEASSSGDEVRSAEMLAFSQGNRNATSTGHDGTPERSSRRSGANDVGEVLKVSEPALGCSEQRDRKPYLDSHSLDRGVASCCVVPQTSLRPLVGKVSHISRRLKINLLDMDAVLPEEALRPSKAHLERRRAWRTFVKSAETIYEIVQATFVLEDMIKTEYLRNEWWYWSSLSAAVKISTLSSLSLRIYSLDAAIVYEKASSDLHLVDNLKPSSILDQKLLPALDMPEKYRATRKSSKKRKDPAG